MSKSRCDLPKYARLQVILSILEILSKDTGLTTSEIFSLVFNKGVKVSQRTILRDLNELSIYAPISEEIKSGSSYWFWVGENRKVSSLDDFWRGQFLEFSKREEQEEIA